MKKWLQNFAYRTHISWWVFLVAAVIALLIAIITIGLQSYQAASANPADSLRQE